MSDKFRIGILGIGVVGGYVGGTLAGHFFEQSETEIIFMARGENAKAIRENGLKIITKEYERTVNPHLVLIEPEEIGKIDLFIICTKAYDLEDSIRKYKDCVGENTIILPLLNGVDNVGKIRNILPFADVWNGCIFIVSRLVKPGIIKVDSEIRLLQFGSENNEIEKIKKVEKMFKTSGIDTEYSPEIDSTVWGKFIFISSLATATSYLDKNIGEIINSEESEQMLLQLIKEVSSLARAKKVNVAENIEKITLEKIRKAPSEATSSMHSDFAKKGRTELETLTGYVVRELGFSKLPSYTYTKLYEELKKISKNNLQADFAK